LVNFNENEAIKLRDLKIPCLMKDFWP